LLTQTEIQQTIRPAQTNAPVNVEGMERLVEKGAAHRHEAVDAQHEDHEAAGVEAEDGWDAQVEAGRVAHDQKAPVAHRAQNGHDAVGEAERAADQVAQRQVEHQGTEALPPDRTGSETFLTK